MSSIISLAGTDVSYVSHRFPFPFASLFDSNERRKVKEICCQWRHGNEVEIVSNGAPCTFHPMIYTAALRCIARVRTDVRDIDGIMPSFSFPPSLDLATLFVFQCSANRSEREKLGQKCALFIKAERNAADLFEYFGNWRENVIQGILQAICLINSSGEINFSQFNLTYLNFRLTGLQQTFVCRNEEEEEEDGALCLRCQ